MNIKRAKKEITDAIEAYLMKDERGEYVIPPVRQRPLLLIGAPGIGKTQIMEQAAREAGVGLVSYTITHHTRQSAIGLPFIQEREYGGVKHSITEYTMSEIVASIYEKIEETGLEEGILFIDEINCVSETLAPAMLQFLQGKTFGNHKIPEGYIIVAAGNPPEYNKSVKEFDIVTLDRVRQIPVEADFEVWKEYAYQVGIHAAVVSYLNVKSENFYQIETTVDGKRFVTPRGWEDLSELIAVYEKLGKEMDREVIGQYLSHPKIAKDFANYLELFYKYRTDYQIEEILNGNRKEQMVDKLSRAPFDEKLSVISLLLAKLNETFRMVIHEEIVLERIAEELGIYKRKIQKEHIFDYGAALMELAEQERQHAEKKRRAGLSSREEGYLYEMVWKRLEEYGKRIQHGGFNREETALEKIKEIFQVEQQEYEDTFHRATQQLEFAFDFLEAAFATGQEMVIFLTELNRNPFSVRILNQYDCERYFQYNKNLLFEDKESELNRRIRDLGI